MPCTPQTRPAPGYAPLCLGGESGMESPPRQAGLHWGRRPPLLDKLGGTGLLWDLDPDARPRPAKCGTAMSPCTAPANPRARSPGPELHPREGLGGFPSPSCPPFTPLVCLPIPGLLEAQLGAAFLARPQQGNLPHEAPQCPSAPCHEAVPLRGEDQPGPAQPGAMCASPPSPAQSASAFCVRHSWLRAAVICPWLINAPCLGFAAR